MAAHPLLYPALAETVLITWRDVRSGTNKDNPVPHFPLPSQYVSVVIVYGALSMFPDSAAKLASAVGWGFVVATLLNFWKPGSTVNAAKPGAAGASSNTSTTKNG